MTDEHPYRRHECDLCGRSLSSKSAGIHDGRGCIFCRGDSE